MSSYKQVNSKSQTYDASVAQQALGNDKRLFGRVAKSNSWPSSSNYTPKRPPPTFVVCGSVVPLKSQTADRALRVQALHRAALSVTTPLLSMESTTEMHHNKVTDRAPSYSTVEAVYSPASTYSSIPASCIMMSCETSSNSLSPISSSFPGHDMSSREQSQVARARSLRQDTELLPRPASAQSELLSTEESLSIWLSAQSTVASLFDHEYDTYNVDHARALPKRDALGALGGANYLVQETNASKKPPHSKRNRRVNGSSQRTPPPSQHKVRPSLSKDNTAVAAKPRSNAICSTKALWGVPTYSIDKKISIWAPNDSRLRTIPTPKPYDGTASKALFDRFVHESTRYLQTRSVLPENQVSAISEFLVGNTKTHKIYYDWLRLQPSPPGHSSCTFNRFVSHLRSSIFPAATVERRSNGLSLVTKQTTE